MQKSGSAYIYNIINDLLVASGSQDARAVKDKYGLSKLMQWHNNNVGYLSRKVLFKLLKVSFKEKDFVVKTHSGPTALVDVLLQLRLVKIVYIYRDPRDVILSAMDHGERIRKEGKHHTFAKMVNFEMALDELKKWIAIFKSYKARKKVLSIRYEDLMLGREKTVDRVCKYLKIKLSDQQIQDILFTYDKENPDANMKGLHFNKAKVNRFKTEMPEDRQAHFQRKWSQELKSMGYEV